MKRIISLIIGFLLVWTIIGAAHATNKFEWRLFYAGCGDSGYQYDILYLEGNHEHNFNWHGKTTGDSGHLKIEPGNTVSFTTLDFWVRVSGPGGPKQAHAYPGDCQETDNPVPEDYDFPKDTPAPAYLVAVLDAGDPIWECNGSYVVDAEGNPYTTPVEYLYWNELGTEIPVSVLILGDYINPADCTALDHVTHVPIEGLYADYDFYTCVAYLGENKNCPGVSDFH